MNKHKPFFSYAFNLMYFRKLIYSILKHTISCILILKYYLYLKKVSCFKDKYQVNNGKKKLCKRCINDQSLGINARGISQGENFRT